ncbi:MAG: ECF transporter S component [Firmicutes bacterium]|nr:ECF transporter S component [Bacillota bacterium]MCL5038478.1 ECF transporter S component [Bacillota bacterium]
MTVREIVVAGLLGGLAIVLGLTPLGFIPVPTPAGAATTMHIPAIIAGIIEGPLVGALVGLIFGLYSFFRATIPLFKDPLVAIGPRVLIGVLAYYAFTLARGKPARPIAAAAVGLILIHTTWTAGNQLNQLVASGKATAFAQSLHGLTSSPLALLVLALLLGGGLGYLVYILLGDESAPAAVGAIVGTLTNTVGVLGMAVYRGYLPAKAAWAVGILHGLPEILVAAVLLMLLYKPLKQAVRR